MCADRDSSSSPARGLRALLGRLLHGLLRHRVFQLLAAAWSYLLGQSGPSPFSLLPSAWLLHRPVGPDELPEVLEALGLRPWEELEDCLEELGPWKELLSPAMKADVDGLKPWPGCEESSSRGQQPWDGAMEGLGSWHSRVRALWEPGIWTELVDPAQGEDFEVCSEVATAGWKKQSGRCAVGGEESGAQVPAVVSCIFHPGSGGAFTWLDIGPEHSPDAEVLSDPRVEIEHIRNKRLWFLQLNQSQEVARDEGRQDVMGHIQDGSVLPEPTLLLKLDLEASGQHNELMSNLEFPGSDSKHCPPSSLLVQKPDVLGNTQSNQPPSPDQDQGYHSLEDWQSINVTQNLQSGGTSPPWVSSVWNNDQAHVPTELSCSAIKDLEDDEGSDDMDSDLEEEIHVPALPVCTNKHIGYILGTVMSDNEDDDSGSSCDEDDDDDGFNSEGSLSATESDSPILEDVVRWTALCSTDPYNPQNFTASLQTGPVVAAVTPHLEEPDANLSTDEESWCDSEDEYSADEQENLKLWNGFLTSEDPYNPFFFKASLQTSEPKRQDRDPVTEHLELVSTSPPSCELTAPTHPSDTRPLRVREKHSVSVEQRANSGHKKVTFYEKVTIYYVCTEEERKGPWEEFARDRCRFQRRIQETESVIGRCFTSSHRQRVWSQMQNMWGS